MQGAFPTDAHKPVSLASLQGTKPKPASITVVRSSGTSLLPVEARETDRKRRNFTGLDPSAKTLQHLAITRPLRALCCLEQSKLKGFLVRTWMEMAIWGLCFKWVSHGNLILNLHWNLHLNQNDLCWLDPFGLHLLGSLGNHEAFKSSTITN